jgi:hypothetical protein
VQVNSTLGASCCEQVALDSGLAEILVAVERFRLLAEHIERGR